MGLVKKTNFNGTLPAPPAGKTNVQWQADPVTANPRNTSAYMPTMVGDTGSGGVSGAVPAPGSGDAAAGKFLKADGTFAVPPGTVVNFADGEVPSGSINGSNTSFTLAHSPNPALSLILNSDGTILEPGGVGFTLSGASLTLVSAPVSVLRAWYRY